MASTNNPTGAEGTETGLERDLLEVLAKHGVQGLPAAATAAPAAIDEQSRNVLAGSYINSIVSAAAVKFDPTVLDQVTRTLQIGTRAAAQEQG